MKGLAIFVVGFSLWFNASAAPVTIYKFDSKEKEEIFYRLSDELRCLVCQNQNIAESNSELAKDLKRQIFDMLKQGKSEDDIVDFMVERYGDYILFNPPFKPLTWLLWLGPLMLFIFGAGLALKIVTNQRKIEASNDGFNSEETSRLNQLKSELLKPDNEDVK